MISFELFFERCLPPLEVLKKYKDDPDVFISFTNIIEPREGKEGTGNTADKSTTRIGLNPLTSYDTPAGVYTYPLKAFWGDIASYDIPFVKDMPYVYVVKIKNPDKCPRTSTYTDEDFERDAKELMEIFPQYHLEDLINTTRSDKLIEKYPDLDGYQRSTIFIGERYRTPPLRMFWSLTRSLAHLIMFDITKKEETKTKHITVWTHIMRQFYDGIIDDTGSGTIHPNEPHQAVFWTNAQFKVIDKIDRTCGTKKNSYNDRSRDEWTGDGKNKKLFSNDKIKNHVINAFSTNSENKLNPQLLEKLKSLGWYDIFMKSKAGDPYYLSVDFANKFDGYFTYRKLALELYLNSPNISDEKVFNNNNLSDLGDVFFEKYAFQLAMLLKDYDSEGSARTIFSNMPTDKYNKDTEPLYYKMVKIMLNGYDGDSSYLISNICRQLSKIPLGTLKTTPKMLRLITKMFETMSLYETNEMGRYMVDIIKLLAHMKVKNPVVWKRFFPYFKHNSNYYKGSDVLEAFINAKTGMEEELKEYINLNHPTGGGGGKDQYNQVWNKYFGVDLYRPKLSQFDAVRKARALKPEIKDSKFKIGDVVTDGYGDAIVIEIETSTNGKVHRYRVEYEDGTSALKPESILELLEPSDSTNFKHADTVEDADGSLYRVFKMYPNNIVEVVDANGNYYKFDSYDLVKYNPKTSLHKPKFKIGELVKVISGSFKGDRGRISDYTPLRMYPYYINDFNDSFKMEQLESVQQNMYNAGDTFVSSGGVYKFTVESYNPDNDTYHVKYYHSEKKDGSDWKLFDDKELVNVEPFDKNISEWIANGSYKQVNDNKDSQQHKHKYNVGDVITGTSSGKPTKFVIKGVDLEHGEYTYDVYKDHGSGWIMTIEDHDYPIVDFETPDKTLVKSVKPEKDALGDDGFPTPKYDVGDVIKMKHKGNFIKGQILEVFHESETPTYLIYWFDDQDKSYELENKLTLAGVDSDPTPKDEDLGISPVEEHKYESGQIFMGMNGESKILVKSYEDGFYHVENYHLQDEGWKMFSDNVVPYKHFEKNVEALIKNGTLMIIDAPDAPDGPDMHNPGDTYTYNHGHVKIIITDIDYTNSKYKFDIIGNNYFESFERSFDDFENYLSTINAKKGPVDPAYIKI